MMFATRAWSRLRERLSRRRRQERARAEPFRYPEGGHGAGRLSYVNGLPVLRLAGAPEELGAQAAVLGLRPADRLLHYPRDLLTFFFRNRLISRLLLRRLIHIGRGMVARFPEPYRRELDGLVAAGLPSALMVAANTMFDMKNMSATGLFGCSSLVVEADRSKTGGPLFGRNMDFFPLGYLQDYGLILVYPRAPGRDHGFVSVGFPGMIGVFSGMNDAGLALASHEVFGPTGRCKFNRKGLTFALSYRRVLESCATIEEALDLLRGTERTTSTSLVCCDRRGAAVFEVTPDHVAKRECVDGLAVCTNHFCSPELVNPRQKNTYRTVDRIETLRTGLPGDEKLDVEGVRRRLDTVHQGVLTLHTMVFEPVAMRMHVSLGPPPATARELRVLDVRELLEPVA